MRIQGVDTSSGNPAPLTDGIRVPLRGRLVGETAKALRLRAEETWDFDIFKSMVLGIETRPAYPHTDEVRTQ
jgi:hypothetical protein